MFQSFTETSHDRGAERLGLLRTELARRGLDGFLVPRADEHQGEYVPPGSERLAWLTGFAGSAGLAVVLPARAALLTDGRYTLQAKAQAGAFEVVDTAGTTMAAWLAEAVGTGKAVVGYDPRLHTLSEIRKAEAALAGSGVTLRPVEGNPLDAVWPNQPAPPRGQVWLHPEALAGEPAAEKISRISNAIAGAGADAAVLSDPTSIAWTFNIRGADVPHVPAPLAFAVLRAEGRPTLFIDSRKLTNSVRDALAGLADLEEPAALPAALDTLGANRRRVLADPRGTGIGLTGRLSTAGATLVEGDDPVLGLKARKNAAELAGARAANIRDGVALTRFLAWLDDAAAGGTLDEIAAATKLEEFRAATGLLKDISFDTIAAAGPHAALPHYRPTEAGNRRIGTGELFLVDSGAQYEDGTTDVTRTVAIGEPKAEMRDRFTRVLKGHIAIATARFPEGTTGAQLDTLARTALWQGGFDFDHGTGHGVGSYLSVHEGPARISKLGTAVLKPGMILSNEPAYYRVGHYGIRTENLVVVREAEMPPGGDRPMLSFETITLAPIDRRLVDPNLMSPAETAWLDAYHARVFAALADDLDAETQAWLVRAAAPL